MMKGQAHAQHAGLFAPALDERSTVGVLDRQPAYNGKAIRMESRRLQGQIITIPLPGRGNNHDAIHASGVHLVQQRIFTQRFGAMCQGCSTWRPGPLRRVQAPEMDLRIDDNHASS
jgi:hypothetical protein